MRKNNYSHRDLKPENILIKYTDKSKIKFDIKLTDFGLYSKVILQFILILMLELINIWLLK